MFPTEPHPQHTVATVARWLQERPRHSRKGWGQSRVRPTKDLLLLLNSNSYFEITVDSYANEENKILCAVYPTTLQT